MKLPNKVTAYHESVLSKFGPTLSLLAQGEISPCELYKTTRELYSSVAQFVDTLDALYTLGKIDYDADKGVIRYVEWNILREIS